MGIMQEFKDFAVKGNVVDMAVGLIIGAEFGKIVNSLVADVIMPPIGLLIGGVDFKNLFVVLKEGAAQAAPYASLADAQKAGAVTMNIGLFVTTVITFTIVAFAVFMLVRAMNKLRPAAPKAALILVSLFSFASADFSWAQSEAAVKSPWTNESQAAVVQTSGNSETESYSLKQESSFTKTDNVYKAKASYLKTSAENKTTGVDEETARRWDAGLRYERTLSERWSAFAGYLVESDKYAGYINRHNSDIGAKDLVAKEENYNVISEAGYRYVHQNNFGSTNENTHYNSVRLYLEGNYQFNATNSGKLWVEYLPNLDVSKDYQYNWEASVSSALSSVFSLKVAYLSKTDNEPVANAEKTDTTLTTALVAKF